jgi:transcriptional regulator of arginine metabolism
MKQGRQSMILELIENHDVETQEELLALLREKGYEVTQATISRDIKELKLAKVQSENGTYKYALSGKEPLGRLDVFRRVFRDTVVSVEAAASLVVVRTMSGSANAAAEAIDVMNLPDVAGTLAGDNTIFVAVKEEGRQQNVVEVLSRMLRSK